MYSNPSLFGAFIDLIWPTYACLRLAAFCLLGFHQKLVEPGECLFPGFDLGVSADAVPGSPGEQESRPLALAVHGHEELFALLDGHIVHVALDNQDRRLDTIGIKDRAVTNIALRIFPWRGP